MPAADIPDYEIADVLEVTTGEQVKALGNLTRHRLLGLLLHQAATTSQLADGLGVLKGSVSFHLRLLETAGLVRVVRTRKVRGVTERYYGRTARRYEILADPSTGARGLPLRTALAELEATTPSADELVRGTRARLTEAQLRDFRQRLTALTDELHATHTEGAAMVNLTVALFPVGPGR
jgi:DNA-binding transcriptional ArsR family regulator